MLVCVAHRSPCLHGRLSGLSEQPRRPHLQTYAELVKMCIKVSWPANMPLIGAIITSTSSTYKQKQLYSLIISVYFVCLHMMSSFRWYKPDYNYGAEILWGRRKGCAFLNSSCADWIDYAKERLISASKNPAIVDFSLYNAYILLCHIQNS